ncbi:hypothetical protein [Limosilactobacillus caviae]|uniref:hypothetical protein n=1 Tax=Limosilactobacillus caviae TaxID=1769424 RepID=UPI001E3DBDB9|nr:hypothetical protein [Limosilactobacillus caviae]MCD7124050.1 hypothetical protein [Limosilactobacillus caviae]
MNRFNNVRPYQKMVTDVSEYRYGNMSWDERFYLSLIKDLCFGEIVSYNINGHHTDFVMKLLLELSIYRMTVIG